MSDPTSSETLSAIIDDALAVDDFLGRARRLATFSAAYSPSLVAALLARAHAAMRQDPGNAEQQAALAVLVAREIEDDTGLVAALRAQGQACVLHGQFPRALDAYDDALAILYRERAHDDDVGELEILRLQPLINLERYADARNSGERVLADFEQSGNSKGQVRAHMALADLAFRIDHPRAALRHYSAVDRLLPSDTNPRVHGALAANRANALEACNRFRAAARHFDRAREIFEAEGCAHTVAQIEYNTAYFEALRGQYDAALRRLGSTQETFVQLDDQRHLALIDLDQAEIHVNLNLPDEAYDLAQQAEQRCTGLGMTKESAQAALLAARAAELRGDTVDAESCVVRAQKRFVELGLSERQFRCLVLRGSLAARRGDPDQARHLANLAVELIGPHGSSLTKASVELLRVRLDLADGKPTEALRRADEVQMDCRRIHAPWVQIEVHRLMGMAYAKRNQVDEAILAYKHAIDELERYRGGVPPDEYMAAFLSGRSGLYCEIVKLLTDAGHIDLAFEFAERAKSRALVDLLAGDSVVRSNLPRTTFTVRRIGHLRERLNAVYQRLFRHDPYGGVRSTRALHATRRQAAALEQQMMQVMREARLHDRESASLQTTDAPSLASVQAELADGLVLIEYLVTADELFTFVVTSDSVRVVRQDVTAEELRRLVQRFRFHLAKFDREEVVAPELVMRATRANLENLAGYLLKPIAESLDGPRLVIAPHGVLHQVPFHALPWGEEWVADRFEVVYTPSAAVYGFCGRKPVNRGGPAAIFGVPDNAAPEIEDEIRDVAAALGTKHAFLGADATLERLRSEASTARVLHIATHGMFRREQPMLSSIRLADTWLNLYDIYGLEMRAELVVLSTCESGTASVTAGDEILGLTRGFLFAGARALMASQWRVHDATTAEFMKLFYGHFAQSGDAAAAQKHAMASIRATRPHPYYWAPFFLTGRPLEHRSRRTAGATDLIAQRSSK